MTTGDPLEVGATVRCERATPSTTTWARYAGRVGTVVTINRQRFGGGSPDHVEVGVTFTASRDVVAWFLPSELIAEPRPEAASARLASATGGVSR
jgi:hypothetical protein